MEIRQNAKGREQNEGECSENKQNPPPIQSKSFPSPIQDKGADKPPARNGWV